MIINQPSLPVQNDASVPVLSPDQLQAAKEAHAVDGRLEGITRRLGCGSEREAFSAVARSLGLDVGDLSKTNPDLSLLESFPVRLIHRFHIFPLSMQRGSLVLAVSDPFNLHAVDAVSSATGLSVAPLLVPADELDKFIKRHLGVGAETIEDLVAQQRLEVGDVQVLD